MWIIQKEFWFRWINSATFITGLIYGTFEINCRILVVMFAPFPVVVSGISEDFESATGATTSTNGITRAFYNRIDPDDICHIRSTPYMLD